MSITDTPQTLSRFVRMPEVQALTGFSRVAIYRLMAEGTFPRSRKIGLRAMAWLEPELIEWQKALPKNDAKSPLYVGSTPAT